MSPRRPEHSTPLRVAGLFAGVGGLELGLERAGHESLLLCEIEPSARAVLHERFPGVRLHDDVTTLARLPARTTLLAAGFPCQDFSQAGRTAGVRTLLRDGARARAAGLRSGLVGQIFRLLQDRPVDWVLLENVPFMLHLDRGRALELIVGALERLNYAWCYRVIDARAFGSPQRRERVYLLASRVADPRGVLLADDAGEPVEAVWVPGHSFGFYWTEGNRGLGAAPNAVPTLKGGSGVGIPSPPAILLPDGRIVTPDVRDAERLQGFPADWTKPAERVAARGARWKLVGNAVCVDVATWIGHRLARPGTWRREAEPVPLAPGDPWPRTAWSLGEGRWAAPFSAWPVHRPGRPIHDFLDHPGRLLSRRATAGFLSRAERSTLRFPPGFLDAVRAHLRRVSASEPALA
jgi:DNA (cytosine-5)-methyltransferase 1